MNTLGIRIKKHFSHFVSIDLMTKRQQFVIVTIVLTIGLLLTQLVPLELRYQLVCILAIIAYGLSAYSLREDLRRVEWMTILTLPTLFTAAVSMFYFLLPVRWLTRLPIAALYGVGMYALLLTENIYNVAADRTIALLRAAHSVGFLLTLVTYFLLVQTVLAFRFYPFITVAIISIISYVLVLQSLWTMELTNSISRRVSRIALAITLFLLHLVWIFSFFPTQTTIKSLLFTSMFYSAVGMGQQFLVEKLYKKTILEFVIVGAIVLFVSIIATSWRGTI